MWISLKCPVVVGWCRHDLHPLIISNEEHNPVNSHVQRCAVKQSLLAHTFLKLSHFITSPNLIAHNYFIALPSLAIVIGEGGSLIMIAIPSCVHNLSRPHGQRSHGNFFYGVYKIFRRFGRLFVREPRRPAHYRNNAKFWTKYFYFLNPGRCASFITIVKSPAHKAIARNTKCCFLRVIFVLLFSFITPRNAWRRRRREAAARHLNGCVLCLRLCYVRPRFRIFPCKRTLSLMGLLSFVF